MDTERKILEERKNKIVAFMEDEAYKPMLLKEIAFLLEVPKDDMEVFENALQELEKEGRIFKTKKERYGVPERMNLLAGWVICKDRGYGFVIPDKEGVGDVFIPADSMNGAMNNDKVIVRISKKSWENKRSEGEIIKITERANKTVVGTFEKSRYFGFVVPDNSKITSDIFIHTDDFNGAATGQKVVVEIIKWPESRRNAEGRIIEIIGDIDQPGTDITSIIKSYNLSETFPEDVVIQAKNIPDEVTEDMVKGRRDLRKLKMVTIDGEDAKDLDDAVSVEILPGGIYRLGVHIADVSFYVKEGTPLDREALKRGTSVYLVDRVIPMLPKKLSNGICSLNPQVDRLAFSVFMDINNKGEIINHEIFESVININERMTYTNVYKILVEKDEELRQRYSYLLEDFEMMRELALILREKRVMRGAIDFDFEEAKIIIDEKGKPIDVKKYEITIANKIIEEFMLVCNETVAEHFYWTSVPFVYRIHEEPDIEKIQSFSEFVHNFGYHLKGVKKVHPRALQDLLGEIKGTKEERIISTVMLRSLQKARYSEEHEGHFGLAAKYYSHFTSPIRRYPDLIIHRIMKEYLKNGMNEQRQEQLSEELREIAKHCSERERAADDAERETEDLKKVEYMKSHEGEIFEGIISNVTSFGMFVELDNTIEGLVRMSSMEDDYYNFNEKQYSLIGERTGKIYRIGDIVKVILARADIANKQIEFILDEQFDEEIDTEIPYNVYGGKKYFKGQKDQKDSENKKTARKRKAPVNKAVKNRVLGKNKKNKKKN